MQLMKKNEILKIFGNSVKAQRKLKGLTQEQLAEISSVSIETISCIERGTLSTTLYTAQLLANALETNLSALLSSSEQNKNFLPELKEFLVKYDMTKQQSILEGLKLLIVK